MNTHALEVTAMLELKVTENQDDGISRVGKKKLIRKKQQHRAETELII